MSSSDHEHGADDVERVCVPTDLDCELATLAAQPPERRSDQVADQLVELPREPGRRDDDLGEVHAERAGVSPLRPVRVVLVAAALEAHDVIVVLGEAEALLRGEVVVLEELLRRDVADADDAHELPVRIGVVDAHPQRDTAPGVALVLDLGARHDGIEHHAFRDVLESRDDSYGNMSVSGQFNLTVLGGSESEGALGEPSGTRQT